MITTEIIKRFRLQVDDDTELSTAEELELANEVYDEIQHNRKWEWLKTSHLTETSTSVPYVDLPKNFKMFYTDESKETVIFVGDKMEEYNIIPKSKERKYRNTDGYCYIDIESKKLYFTKQPTEVKSVEFDYIFIADPLLFPTEPLFREGYHKMIAYGMAARFYPMQLTEKKSSYQNENRAIYEEMLSDMSLEDAYIKLNI